MKYSVDSTFAKIPNKLLAGIAVSNKVVLLRSVLCGISIVSASVVGIAMTTASVAEANSANACIPLVHKNLKIKPTYYYKPNGQSYVRVFMETRLVNASPDKVYYTYGNGNQPAFSSLNITSRGQLTRVKNNEQITETLAPGGITRYGMRQLGDRPVDVKLPHQNVDMKITLRATMINPNCRGHAYSPYIEATYDLRPLLDGGRAKQIGRTRLNYSGPAVAGSPTHTPGSRGKSPSELRLEARRR